MSAAATKTFEEHRPLLTAIAYRMLGERSLAEDVVQDVWLRWADAAPESIEKPAAWLKLVTTRLSIDALRSAKSRREIYVGPWLPEPIIESEEKSPEAVFSLAQECELALLWAMERLAPEERAAFILREAFETDYHDIAALLGKPEPTCRKIVSRAADRVRQATPRFETASADVQDLLTRFAAATVAGNREEVLRLLAPDAVALTDGGGKVRAALRPLEGAAEIAQVLISVASKGEMPQYVSLVWANRHPAIFARDAQGQGMLYLVMPDQEGRISWIYLLRNPEKLG